MINIGWFGQIGCVGGQNEAAEQHRAAELTSSFPPSGESQAVKGGAADGSVTPLAKFS